MDDLIHKESLLKTSQCLAIAQGAIAYAIASIENGSPGVLAIQVLKKDQETIRELLK